MTADRLDRIAETEGNHFWFTARRRIVADAWARLSLPPDPKVLDVGCGTGANLRELAPNADAIGLDPLRHHLRGSLRRGPCFVQGSALALPIRGSSIDLALALDVIEHIDDVASLHELHRVIRPRGHLIVTVPAGPWLWSRRDDDAGHLRRYTRETLCTSLRSGGFDVRRCSPFHGALLPLLIASRLAGRVAPYTRDLEDQPPSVVNSVLSRVTAMEASLAERGIMAPWGSSLLAVARMVP